MAKYQTKELYSGGAYYKEIAEVIVAPNIDLSTQITVYPNPFDNKIVLVSEKAILPENMIILNSLGKNVTNYFQLTTLAKNKIRIVSKKNSNKGVYFVLITTKNYIVSKKIIKS